GNERHDVMNTHTNDLMPVDKSDVATVPSGSNPLLSRGLADLAIVRQHASPIEIQLGKSEIPFDPETCPHVLTGLYQSRLRVRTAQWKVRQLFPRGKSSND